MEAIIGVWTKWTFDALAGHRRSGQSNDTSEKAEETNREEKSSKRSDALAKKGNKGQELGERVLVSFEKR